MEYYPGITLQKWLKHCKPKMAVRWHLAQTLMWQIYLTSASGGPYHGDLHWRNILIGASVEDKSIGTEREFQPDFTIIDFGTSIFASPDAGIQRHWKKVNETFVHLLAPLDINKIVDSYSGPQDVDSIYTWYQDFLKDVPRMLAAVGAKSTSMSIGQSRGSLSQQARDTLERLIADGKLSLDYTTLGAFKEWFI